VAESFCRAAANVQALRQCDRHDLYLLTIARNLCRDRFRRRAVATDDEPLDDCPDDTPRPDESAEHAERRRKLIAAVEQLPEALREVVALRLGSGLKFEEIAELLGAPLGTVLSRMHSAVQRLRQHLGYDRERA
jgi:RNA polymerase sigma-70 factor (ECF subfamily)